MNLGLESVRDVLEVLLVPFSLGLLAVVWPAPAERRRRLNFESLIRRELQEAKPRDPGTVNSPWNAHLARRFLHEEIIRSTAENVDFVLSLAPELAYHVSQLWIEFDKAQEELRLSRKPSPGHASQFSWHLKETTRYLDRRGRFRLYRRGRFRLYRRGRYRLSEQCGYRGNR